MMIWIFRAATTVALLFPAALAQAPRAAGPIVYGHHHLNVTSVAEHQRFWAEVLGGTPVKILKTDNVKFPGGIVRLRQQPPSGGTGGSSVDHVALEVADLDQVLAKVRAAGFQVVTSAETVSAKAEVVRDGIVRLTDEDVTTAFVMGPDDVKVELVANTELAVPVAMQHVHFAGTAPDEMRTWYAKTLGTRVVRRGRSDIVELPDASLRWLSSPRPAAPTRGRVLDHIGFEVSNLKALCKRLESQGVKFDRPFAEVPDLGISNAFVIDPWGTYIELTEGLRALVE